MDRDGGDGAQFLTVEAEHGVVSFDAPTDLGVPVIEGSQVTWPMLDEGGVPIVGVALTVDVAQDASGATPVIDVADADAYEALSGVAGPAGVGFTLRVSDGLRLARPDGPAGGLAVLDVTTGQVELSGGTPLQWDSAGDALGDGGSAGSSPSPSAASSDGAGVDDAGPAEGDVVSPLAVSVADAQTMVVEANEAMVADSDTVWPITIDPEIENTRNEWMAVRSVDSIGVKYKSVDTYGEGVGLCLDDTCAATYKSRLLWEFAGLDELMTLSADDLLSAKFSTWITHSSDCSTLPLDLYLMAADISSATRWSTMPATSKLLATNSPRYYDDGECGSAQWVDWDVLGGVSSRLGKGTTMTLGMRSRTEDSFSTWRRFRMNDATLTVVYNLPPEVPILSSMQMGVDGSYDSCKAVGAQILVASTTPTMAAVISDPDSTVKGEFEVYQGGSMVWSARVNSFQTSGIVQRLGIPGDTIKTDVTAKWRVRAVDSKGRMSAWSPFCQFLPDATAPHAPRVSAEHPSAAGDPIAYVSGEEAGGVGVTGCFLFDVVADTDVNGFLYGLDASSAAELTAPKVPNASGRARKCFTPVNAGPHWWLVVAVDEAGNVSRPTTYWFSVAESTEDVVWSFDSKNTLTQADPGTGVKRVVFRNMAEAANGDDRGDMLSDAVAWTRGPHGLFEAREGDWAPLLDGVDDELSSRSSVLDASSSFVVSAHVRLDSAESTAIAVSQDTGWSSAWKVGYHASGCPSGATGCWAFSMYGPSGAPTRVYSTVAPVVGRWTMLLAEYDKAAGKQRLWVCDIGTPQDPSPGEPVGAEAPAPVMGTTVGVLALGRAEVSDAGAQWWTGAIDNVRVFQGDVVAPAKIRRVCQGAEANQTGVGPEGGSGGTATWRDLDPTTGGN
ncbi:LamG domain-containing protein [Cellulomonas composti]|uniref:LamG domain-containing protein n=1 Tax=Cellulomonas composti TaxID=266130 RepID=UPI001649CA49|nr:LamG domain-containing protein [Cellulomonas composti]